MTSAEVRPVPPPPPAAAQLFGDRLALAQAYAQRLAVDGVDHGHVGPREIPRIWDRHLVNSALVAELVPAGPARVVDVGSGAGLPGLPLAIARPDLSVTLLEPMLRRTRFLESVIAELGLVDVEVVRGRAGDAAVTTRVGGCGYVVARAVAPLDRLVGWCLPLLRDGGVLLALKGERADVELAEQRRALDRLGVASADVVSLGPSGQPTRVVRVVRGDRVPAGRTTMRQGRTR